MINKKTLYGIVVILFMPKISNTSLQESPGSLEQRLARILSSEENRLINFLQVELYTMQDGQEKPVLFVSFKNGNCFYAGAIKQIEPPISTAPAITESLMKDKGLCWYLLKSSFTPEELTAPVYQALPEVVLLSWSVGKGQENEVGIKLLEEFKKK